MKPDKIEVGKRIKFIKENYRPPISLNDFGELLLDEKGSHLSKGTVNSWMRGLALPPAHLVEQIAKLGDTTIDWLYWGSIDNYITAYLNENRYGKLIEENPEVQALLKEKLEDVGYSDQRLPSLSVMNQIFKFIYRPMLEKYIDDVCEPYVEQTPKYLFTGIASEGSEEVQKYKFSQLIKSKINSFTDDNQIVWGDKEKIEEIANEQLERWIQLYTKSSESQNKDNESILLYLIEHTKDKRGVEKLLSEVAAIQTGKMYSNIYLTDEIAGIFIDFGRKLEKKVSTIKDK